MGNYDVDVYGLRWIEVMRRLIATDPDVVVVPGHGDISGPQVLADVRDYLELLRDETWVRRDSAMSTETIVAGVTAAMIERLDRFGHRGGLASNLSSLSAHPLFQAHDGPIEAVRVPLHLLSGLPSSRAVGGPDVAEPEPHSHSSGADRDGFARS